MTYRRSIGLTRQAYQVVRKAAEEHDVSGNQIIEMAILWWERCERATKGRRIVSITVENPDGSGETFRVL